jgi:hypothetical protein
VLECIWTGRLTCVGSRVAPERVTVKVVAGTETGSLKFAVNALAPEVKRFSNK